MKSILKKLVVSILTFEAKLILRKYKPKIIAVTGSVGKTSTKDAIFTVFSKVFFARKSNKSFNSETGIPLTILDCPSGWSNPLVWIKNFWTGLALILFPNNYPEWLILEVGADRPNDIKKVATWIPVDIAVFTRMSEVPVHVEFFKSPEELFKEKMNLLGALKKTGTIIFNYDDEKIRKHILSLKDNKRFSYGFDVSANVTASNYQIIYEDTPLQRPIGINFKINFGSNSLPINLTGTLGKQQIYAILASMTCAMSGEINLVEASSSLLSHKFPPGRMRVLDGVSNSTIIDDSYNSSPVALSEALGVMEILKISGKKIAVLGDMMELGDYSLREHKKAGHRVKEVVDMLITVGVRAKYIAEAAIESGFAPEKIMQFTESRSAGEAVLSLVGEGDVVLVKGSQSIRLERVVEEIMSDISHKKDLLVRQDDEWLVR